MELNSFSTKNSAVMQNSLSLLLNLDVLFMKNQNPYISRISMNAGAFLGTALVFYTFISYKLDFLVSSQGAGFINYVLILAGLYYATRYYRDKFLQGFISYGDAVKFGISVSFYASIIMGFFTYILYKYIDTNLINQLFEFQEKALLDSGISEDEVEKTMELVRVATTPGLLFLSSIFSVTLIGTVISLINSIFLKRNPNPFDQAMSEIKEEQN